MRSRSIHLRKPSPIGERRRVAFFHLLLSRVNRRLWSSKEDKLAIRVIGFVILLCCNIALSIPEIEGNSPSTITVEVFVQSDLSSIIQNARVWIEETSISDLARPLVSVIKGSASLKSAIRSGEKVEANLSVIVKAANNPVDIPVNLEWQTSKHGDYLFYLTKNLRVDPSGPQTYSVSFRIDESSCIRRLEWRGPSPTINAPDRGKIHPGIMTFNGYRGSSKRLIYVLVMDAIWSSLSDKIWRFADDVNTTYSTSVWAYSGNDPVQIRNWLSSERSTHPDLVGCLLVGDVPEAWYEIPAHQGWSYESFPIDLFYMDTDGVWVDSDANGIYETHTGDTAPEIWIGRLKASNIGDQVELLGNYFDKNHRYRTGELQVQYRALSYVDDDWKDCYDIDAVREVYPETLVVNDPAITTGQDYKNRVAQGYQWVHLMCHGWPGGHVFKVPDGPGESVYSSEYFASDWPVLFYNFFVCSGARYTEPGYLAGASIFPPNRGLLAVGSTKTGSMIYFFEFYRPLSTGKSVGDALMDWWLVSMGYDWFRDWSYGLTIIGDPTINITRGQVELGYDDNEPNFGWTVGYAGAAAVKFSPPQSPFVLTKVKVNGWWSDSGSGTFYLEIWDTSRNELYQASYRYDQYFNSWTSWAGSIPIPDIKVYGDFYVVLAPNPIPGGPAQISKIQPSQAKNSQESSSGATWLWISCDNTYPISGRSYGANIEANTIDYQINDFNFMIRSVGRSATAAMVGLLNFDDYRNRMGSLTPMEPSTTFYFPHYHQDSKWQTFIAIANPNTPAAGVTLTFYSNNGVPVATRSFDVGAGCKVGYLLSSLGITGTGWIKVESNLPVVGLLNFDDYANRMGSMSGVTPASAIYFPHFHEDAKWQTYYAIVNPSDTGASITVTYYQADGTVVSTDSLTLDPYQKIGRFAVSGTGWISVQSDTPIVGMLNFDDYRNRMGTIEHATPSSTLYFPHFHQDSSWQTYYAIANPSDTSASVTVTYYRADGSVITTDTLTLNAYSKLGRFAVGGTGWIKVESTVPIVGMLNFDDYRNRMGSIVAVTPQSSAIFPHFHQDSNWETFYAIVNLGPSATFDAAYCRADGSTITIVPTTVATNSKVGRFATGGTGWLKITPPI